MAHGNWLRNRLPYRRARDGLQLLAWKPNTTINLDLAVFGQTGFAFLYTSSTTRDKKFNARATHSQFIGMHSDERLCRVLETHSKSMLIKRLSDFRPCKNEPLLGLAALLNGIARQSEIEQREETEGAAEDGLVQEFMTALSPINTTPHCFAKRAFDPNVPKAFSYAVKLKVWRAAIDREFNALVIRGTWTYTKRTPEMHVLPYTWVFRLKLLDAAGTKFLEKARCCVRGDLQSPEIDFDPFGLHAPVASHEAIRLVLSVAAADDLIVERGDIANA